MSGNNFANHIEAEFAEISEKKNWLLVYHKIGCGRPKIANCFSEAKKHENKHLNRYRDVTPYDHSRIILRRSETDYINASLVPMPRAQRVYILTQGPLPNTVSHFWLMVWEQNSHAILMLNKLVEKKEVKCHGYWPNKAGFDNRLIMENVNLAVELVEMKDHEYYLTRILRLHDLNTNKSRDVIQFHYTTWPDFGVPQSPTEFLDFLDKVRYSGALDIDVGPPVVHCSAGIGRSGTFCLVDCCMVIIENEGVRGLNIQRVLTELRGNRMGLVQSPEQLRFAYQAIIEGIKRLGPEVRNEPDMGERVYAPVADDEEDDDIPPSPPPRGASLGDAPARPLPAIPASASLGNLNLSKPTAESSSSEEVVSAPPTPLSESSSLYSSEEESDKEATQGSSVSLVGEFADAVRRRRLKDKELADRIADMKRRSKESDKWHALKRSLYKPLTITLGFILAGIFIYSYVKH